MSCGTVLDAFKRHELIPDVLNEGPNSLLKVIYLESHIKLLFLKKLLLGRLPIISVIIICEFGKHFSGY